uniref:DNA primase n=1 Tax=Pyramimonas obovata TaxID=1411642 RepID=A0A7S0N4R3_9CHLO|mmetsp:Transcript_19465/g.42595  ORF Transcript_19465/g.42595 Transcript_19465/m.42595 type:complete len:476 (+) Transcript_19465:54-1481(+)|eukprot:CAMPEP_0118956804 /NCGR_PEP_ID=MMETSP1169-20130426/61771_1 /TAXON_ID=36882 /ORGANISM="Pyramimonas obovata, Strain CCMP722" /LENGTH=475 /DNA_ID=CAMNT_0006904851 /DNA_START=54 /DNA_END=1481 /DNA_ORIENTATION=-
MGIPMEDDHTRKKARVDDDCGTAPMEHDENDAGNTQTKFSDTGKVHDLMPLYYGRLFPTTEMFKWLAYGNDQKHPQADAGFFQRREFCFTLEGEIFVRYQSFKSASELHAALKDKVPEKIDLGPVYNVDPQRRSAYSTGGSERVFAPVERELVFDVDMTDYDDVRTCCSGADICNKCWPLMTIAIKVIDRGLRDDFGFESLFWVYSGRRGVHCWVCDSKARSLSDEARGAVAEYFSVYKGGQNKKVAVTNPLHPALSRAFDDVLLPYWEQVVLPAQRFLEHEEHMRSILEMVPLQDVRDTIAGRWGSASNKRGGEEDGALSVSRWTALKETVQKHQKRDFAMRKCIHEIVFTYVYPRLDAEVSKHMNHLLKAPFCVHPKTGRVCVPIDPEVAEEFDPLEVPTVARLLNELDRHEHDHGKAEGPRGEEHGKTSFGPYVQAFRKAFLTPLHQQLKHEFSEKVQASKGAANIEKAMEW